MYDNAKEALKNAIRAFFTHNDIFDDATLSEAANTFVYEHDEEVREHLRDQTDLEDIFESILDNIDWYDLW